MATDHFSALSKQRYDRGASGVALALAAILAFAASGAEPDEPRQTETRIVTLSMMAPLSTTGETPPMKGQVPQAILDPILKEAAALAKLDREQLGDRARRIGDLERRLAGLPGTGNDVHASSG